MDWSLIGKLFIIAWPLSGVIGFAMYCSNKHTRPKKWYLLCAAFCTHAFFGFMGLAYGYFCFSGRKNKCLTS